MLALRCVDPPVTALSGLGGLFLPRNRTGGDVPRELHLSDLFVLHAREEARRVNPIGHAQHDGLLRIRADSGSRLGKRDALLVKHHRVRSVAHFVGFGLCDIVKPHNGQSRNDQDQTEHAHECAQTRQNQTNH